MNRTLYITAIVVMALFSSCTPKTTSLEPKISNITVSDVTVFSAMVSGTVEAPNSPDIIEFGIEYTSSDIFDELTTRRIEADADDFHIVIKNLNPHTRYKVRTYYIDYNGSGNLYRYSTAQEFLTPYLDEFIRTDDATDISKGGATLNGYVDTTGCIWDDRVDLGFVIGTSSTTINEKKSYTSYDQTTHILKDIEGELTEYTRYYYRSYVTLDGTSYFGEIKEFLTSDIKAKVYTYEADEITQTSVTLSGSLEANEYGQDYRFYYSDKYETLEELIDPQKSMTVKASGNDNEFSASLSSLTAGTPYFYVAAVTVKGIDFYGDIKAFTTLKEVPPTPPTPHSKEWPSWYELPSIGDGDGDGIDDADATLYYAKHSFSMSSMGSRQLRNYTVCFSAEHHCPVWVAAPRHSVYSQKGTTRKNSYQPDPDIPSSIQYKSKSTGGNCNKGHMVGSEERLCCAECNRQVFYYSNIAPQLQEGFNTGGGGWNLLEDFVDSQVCSDTLYVVIGCYFDTYKDGYGYTVEKKTISFGDRDDVSFPTMFYYILLRTKTGNSHRPVNQCSATEIKCAAFVRSHTNKLKGQKPSKRELMSVADLEKLTGFTYFPNVPNAPKTVCNSSDWGL